MDQDDADTGMSVASRLWTEESALNIPATAAEFDQLEGHAGRR
jgi:hypothetical protein